MAKLMIQRVLCLVVLLLSGAAAVHAQAPLLQPGDRIAVIGDSITEQRKYSALMEAYFLACKPLADVQTIQFGWSGERAPGFNQRLENDVLPFKPTVATTCYGMNDGSYTAYTDPIGNAYRDATRQIVKKFKAAGVRTIVVGSPGVVDSTTYKRTPHNHAVYNATLAKLRDIAKAVAEEEGVAFADVHTTMYDAMGAAKARYGDDYPVAGGDGVHPDWNGHLAMAYAFLKTLLGPQPEIAKIEFDYAANTATASSGHTVQTAGNGAVELESSRYPFCFLGEPGTQSSSAGLLPFIPFNQEFNRFTLTVRNAPARAKITWGDASKEFDKAQLEQGINLAAEFVEANPFKAPFQKVMNAVQAKQLYEMQMIRQYITQVPRLKQMAPDETESVDRIAAALVRQHPQRAAETAAVVTPVRHTIKIEEVK